MNNYQVEWYNGVTARRYVIAAETAAEAESAAGAMNSNVGSAKNTTLLNTISDVGDFLTLPVLTAEPTPADGMVAYADGTSWNPGAGGEGVYAYYGAAWNKLG